MPKIIKNQTLLSCRDLIAVCFDTNSNSLTLKPAEKFRMQEIPLILTLIKIYLPLCLDLGVEIYIVVYSDYER